MVGMFVIVSGTLQDGKPSVACLPWTDIENARHASRPAAVL